MGKPGRRDDRVRDEGLRTGTDDDVIRMNVDMSRPVQEIRRGFAQFEYAGRRRIAVLAYVDGLDTRFADVLRRREIRLANAEGNDVLPLALQGADFGKNDESVFGTELVRSAGNCGHELHSSEIKKRASPRRARL